MNEVIELRVEIIEVGERVRALDDAACARLMTSMTEIGLRQPISVRIVDRMVIDGSEVDGVPVLVAGRHRLEAAKRLNWSHIECIAVGDDVLRAELWEIDENLMRAELSPAQQAAHLSRRKEIWAALNIAQSSREKAGRPQGFAGETESATGTPRRTTQQHLSRAEALGADLQSVAGTSLDKGVELDALAKMKPEQRAPIIARAIAGEAVTARAPMRDDDVIEKQVDAVMAAWNKACPEARDRVRDLIDTPVFDRGQVSR